MSGLPKDRDETLGERSTVENSLLNRLQQGVVDLHENEYYEERVSVFVPGPVQTAWTYNGTSHYFASTGVSQKMLIDIGEVLAPGARLKNVFVMMYRPTGSTLGPILQSNAQAADGDVDSFITHGTMDNPGTFDAWELVELQPVADVSLDPDNDMIIKASRAYYLSLPSTVSGERIGAIKTVVQRLKS